MCVCILFAVAAGGKEEGGQYEEKEELQVEHWRNDLEDDLHCPCVKAMSMYVFCRPKKLLPFWLVSQSPSVRLDQSVSNSTFQLLISKWTISFSLSISPSLHFSISPSLPLYALRNGWYYHLLTGLPFWNDLETSCWKLNPVVLLVIRFGAGEGNSWIVFGRGIEPGPAAAAATFCVDFDRNFSFVAKWKIDRRRLSLRQQQTDWIEWFRPLIWLDKGIDAAWNRTSDPEVWCVGHFTVETIRFDCSFGCVDSLASADSLSSSKGTERRADNYFVIIDNGFIFSARARVCVCVCLWGAFAGRRDRWRGRPRSQNK